MPRFEDHLRELEELIKDTNRRLAELKSSDEMYYKMALRRLQTVERRVKELQTQVDELRGQ